MYDIFSNLLDSVVFVIKTALQVLFIPPVEIIAHIEQWVISGDAGALVRRNYERLRNGILVALAGCIFIPIAGLSLAMVVGNWTTAAQVIVWLTCMGLSICIIILALAAAPFPIVYTVLWDLMSNAGAGLANLKAFFRGGSHTDYPQLAQTLAMAKRLRTATCLAVGLVMAFFVGVLLTGMFETPKGLGLAILAAFTLMFVTIGLERKMGPLIKASIVFGAGLVLVSAFLISGLYFWGLVEPDTGEILREKVKDKISKTVGEKPKSEDDAEEDSEAEGSEDEDSEESDTVVPASSKKSGKAAADVSKPKVKKPEPTRGELAEQARQRTRERVTVSVLNLTPWSLHAIVSYDACRGKDATTEEILVPKRGYEGLFEQIVPCDTPLHVSVYRVAPDGSDDLGKRWEYFFDTTTRRFDQDGEPYNSGTLETTANGALRFAVLDNEYTSDGRPIEVAASGSSSPRLNKPRVYDPTTRTWR